MDAATSSVISQALQIGIPSLVAILNGYFLYRQGRKSGELQLVLAKYQNAYSGKQKVLDLERDGCQKLIEGLIKMSTTFSNYVTLAKTMIDFRDDSTKRAFLDSAQKSLAASYEAWHNFVMNELTQIEALAVMTSDDAIYKEFSAIKLAVLHLSSSIGYDAAEIKSGEVLIELVRNTWWK